jgi:hypothetical protein
MTKTSSIGTHYLIIFLAAAALYGVSCAPGAVWQDSGLIQYRVWHNDIEGFLGLALSHPLYYLLAIAAKYIPLGAFGHRVNLVSAAAGAVAVANVYLLVRLWLGRAFPAVIAAATLALAHTFWWHASIAETYTLWTALFTGELIMLLQYTRTGRVRYLYLLGLLNGLALAVHMLAAIPLVYYAVLLVLLLGKRAIRVRDVAAIGVLWVIGALPLEYLIVTNMATSGQILGTLASAAFGDRWQGAVLNARLSWGLIRDSLLFPVLNFPTPNGLLFFVGLYALYKVKPPAAFRNLILALLILFFAFAARYTIADRYAFFIPFYTLTAVVIGWGVHEFLARVRHRAVPYLVGAFTLLPLGIYATAPVLAEHMRLPLGTRQDIPYRNDYEYFLRPWRTGYTGAERFAREALAGVGHNAVLHADTTTVAPLLYVQEVAGVRPDVQIVTGIVSSRSAPMVTEYTMGLLLERYPVYVVSRQPAYCPAFILRDYTLTEAGILWRVSGPPAP